MKRKSKSKKKEDTIRSFPEDLTYLIKPQLNEGYLGNSLIK